MKYLLCSCMEKFFKSLLFPRCCIGIPFKQRNTFPSLGLDWPRQSREDETVNKESNGQNSLELRWAINIYCIVNICLSMIILILYLFHRYIYMYIIYKYNASFDAISISLTNHWVIVILSLVQIRGRYGTPQLPYDNDN